MTNDDQAAQQMGLAARRPGVARGVAALLIGLGATAALACGPLQAARPATSSPGAGLQPGSTQATPGTAPHGPLSALVSPQARSSAAPAPAHSPYPQYVAGTQEAPVVATLAYSCVIPGGPQTLTLSGTPDGGYVSVDSEYSNHKDGQKYGGIAYTTLPPGGIYKLAWTVSPSAPIGPVTVWVAVAAGGGGKPVVTAYRQPMFKVARSC